jgi:hypothetical protein
MDVLARPRTGGVPCDLRKDSHLLRQVIQALGCAVQFQLLANTPAMERIARVTWFLNLGRKEKPRAGRRSRYWVEWLRASGGLPRREDRISPRVFCNRLALVRVVNTSKTFNSAHVEPGVAYSVVRDVLEWRTGGGSPE